MAANISPGELRGDSGWANCRVTTGPDGDDYISDVIPALPDGDYDLVVNGLVQKVRQTNGVWKKISD